MDIDGLGGSRVQLLLDEGLIKDAADIYYLKAEELMRLEKMGEKSADNLLQAIDKVMITDSLKVKGLPAGTRTLFGGNLIELFEDGSAHLVDAGNLAGSTLKVNQGLRNLVEKAGVPWQTAINSCTINPARLIGMESSKGSITAGKDADLVVLGDDYSVQAAYVCGERCY